MQKTNTKPNMIERPPVVVVMGHIDHGKSTLLDYIRKSNVVLKEAGGITQHISAYEVVQKDASGTERKITFLDTPGHAAFSKMRQRGAEIADIAILIVSAEDGVKPQTIEAWKTINESHIPCIVAINKIDKPGANIEKTKTELAENEIYLENYGGKIPFAAISAKEGTGVDELLSLVLIMSEMESLTGNKEEPASGLVIEANLDPKRGIQATLIIKNGTLQKGMIVAAEDSLCPARIMENFLGQAVSEASFSSPVRLVGFDKIPRVGGEFKAFRKKDEALLYTKNFKHAPVYDKSEEENANNKKVVGIVLKADVFGSIEAIEKEVSKVKTNNTVFKIIQKGVGAITESDVKAIALPENSLIIGFNVKADRNATELALKRGIPLSFFDIIYKMTEWLEGEMESRRLKVETKEILGQAKVLKTFSRTKERQIIGGKVTSGSISLGGSVKILRRDFEIGSGKVVNLEKNKNKTSTVEEGSEFGTMIESKIEIAPGDVLESFVMTQK